MSNSTIPCTASQNARTIQGGIGPLFGGTVGAYGMDGACILNNTLQGAAAVAAGSSGPSHFLAGSIGSADLGPALVQLAVVTVTSAALLALNDTQFPLIAAPPAGKSLVLAGSVVFRFNWNSIQYTGGGAISIFESGASTNLLASTVPATFVTTPTAAVTSDAVVGPLSTILTIPQATGISLSCATADFAAGNSTLTLIIPYRIV